VGEPEFPIKNKGMSGSRKQCPKCPLSFQRTEHLLRHALVHSGVKPFECSECQRGFSRQDALHRHKKIHLKKSIEYGCAEDLVQMATVIPKTKAFAICNLIN
jgi:transposase-like protein